MRGCRYYTGGWVIVDSARTLSVVIPAFNARRVLPAALRSVRAQLLPAGDVDALEIVVVDDGSTDTTRAWLDEQPDLVLVAQPRGGPAAARNAGVARARGRYLAFLDADDCWAPDKTRHQLAALQDGVDLVFGHTCEFLDDSSSSALPPVPVGPPLAAHVAGALLIRREAFLRVGLFSTAWRVGEFVDWGARARQIGFVSVTVPEVVLYRRIHAANSTRQAEAHADYVRIVKRALDRRRGGG